MIKITKHGNGKKQGSLKDLLCPITSQIFFKPVVAEDGIVYEEQALIGLLKKTKQKSRFNYCSLIKNMVDVFLKENPQFASRQYSPVSTYDRFIEIFKSELDEIALLGYNEQQYRETIDVIIESMNFAGLKEFLDPDPHLDEQSKINRLSEALISRTLTDNFRIKLIELS